MADPVIKNCQITRLPSGVYELAWWICGTDEEPRDRNSGFYTKAQLMKFANNRHTYEAIRSFLRDEFRNGQTIK